MSQVKDVIKDHPEFLANYYIICMNSVISKFGDEFFVYAISNGFAPDSIYSDVITTIDNQYIRLGHEKYQRTLEMVESLSLLKECDRLLNTSKMAA